VAVIAFGVWQKMQPVPQAPHLEGTINAGFDQIVDDVGYIPGANYRVTARRVADGKVIYDVTYTVDANGFRIVPPHPDDPPESCVLLFGDSFTFGEGVQDDETFAADIVRQSGGKVAAVNLGESGWGPHQLLAGLQSGRFQKDVTCKPTDAVYLMIPDHVGRAVGRSPWDKHGPRFRLDAEGKPVRDGNFDSPGPPVSPNPDLDEGFLGWRRMLLGVSALGTPKEAEFTSALLIDSAREMKQAWPGIRVHLIDWNPYDNRRAAEIGARLKVAGIDVRPLDAIIPDYLDHIDRYLIAPKIEAHPNVTGHKRIAAYILHEIVAKKP
jgi:hypothetical protein